MENVTIGVLELADSHTLEHISEWFEKLLKDWGISKEQVLTVVTDNGSNILNAVKKNIWKRKTFAMFCSHLKSCHAKTFK